MKWHHMISLLYNLIYRSKKKIQIVLFCMAYPNLFGIKGFLLLLLLLLLLLSMGVYQNIALKKLIYHEFNRIITIPFLLDLLYKLPS
jgi:hypothetical protein